MRFTFIFIISPLVLLGCTSEPEYEASKKDPVVKIIAEHDPSIDLMVGLWCVPNGTVSVEDDVVFGISKNPDGSYETIEPFGFTPEPLYMKGDRLEKRNREGVSYKMRDGARLGIYTTRAGLLEEFSPLPPDHVGDGCDWKAG